MMKNLYKALYGFYVETEKKSGSLRGGFGVRDMC